MKKGFLALLFFLSSSISSSICETPLGQKTSYKDYCERKNELASKFNIKLSFQDFEDSKKLNLRVTSEEIDYVLNEQIEEYFFPNLSKSELKDIYLFNLLAQHSEEIGVQQKRKYNSQVKRYFKNLNKSLKILENNGSRKESRIDRHLKGIRKQVQAYGMEFTNKAVDKEKEIIRYHFEAAKKSSYEDSLIDFEIKANASSIRIYLDGKSIGRSPKKIFLEPRKYSLLLKSEAFNEELTIDPSEKDFYFADFSNSKWTKSKASSLLSSLQESTSIKLEFNESLDKESFRTIKDANNFIKDYKNSFATTYEMNEEVKKLTSLIESRERKVEDSIKNRISESLSLDEFEKKIDASKQLMKDLKRVGLNNIQLPGKDSLIAFLDFDQEIIKLRNDKKYYQLSRDNFHEKKLKDFKYLVYAKILSDDIEQKIISKKEKAGSFHYNTIQKYNTNYDKALQRRDSAYRAYLEAKMIWEERKQICANQPSNSRAFWCAVLYAPDDSKYRAAQRALENTPRIIDEKQYAKYNFIETKVEAIKNVEIEVGIINLKKNVIYTEDIKKNFSKDFKFYSGLRDDDENKNEYVGDSQTSLERFFESKPKINISSLTKDIKNYEFDSDGKALRVSLGRFVSSLEDQSIRNSLKNKNKNKNRNRKNDGLSEFDERFDSVVKVLDKIEGSSGTGFYVEDNLIITNEHVVGKKRIINLTNFNGENFTGRVIKVDQDADLALIMVNKLGTPILFYDRARIRVGSPAEAIGHPQGLDFSISRGVVSSLRKGNIIDFGREIKQIQMDVPINRGNSGGPLFIGNKFIGVNTFKRFDIDELKDGDKVNLAEGLNFAVHYHEVLDFIESN